MVRVLEKRNGRERGFTLVMLAACAVVMVGMLGLATDLGRVYIAKNEVQAFVDASSVAAALKLNGTAPGLAAADSAATGPLGPGGAWNSWYFATQSVPAPVVTYSTAYNGAYSQSSSAAATSRL